MDKFVLAERLVKVLKNKGLTASFAESCTGGLASATVVSVSGASEVFYGSIVSYDNSVKENLLFVPSDILKSVGAVSEECVCQMALGAKKQLGTNLAISVTGIAGPLGGTKEKPVGLVYIGFASDKKCYTKKLLLTELGDRTAIREASVCEMLSTALEELNQI